MDYVIVGNSAAAIGAVEGIRNIDQDGRIIIVGDEKYPAYSRPMISHLLAGDKNEQVMDFRPREFYRDNRVKVVTGKRAVAFDPDQHLLWLEQEERLTYNRLLLATGGKPADPNLPGCNGPHVFHFLSRRDVAGISSALNNTSRAVILGAGLIALKAAEALHRRGVEVTVVVRSRLLRSILDDNGAEIVHRHLEAQGIKFIFGWEAESLEGEGAEALLILKDGRRLPCPLLLLAAGVLPNTALAESAGLECSDGIPVNDKMLTPLPDVSAAGDCARLPQLLGGKPKVTPLWPVAFNSGKYAGMAMAGGEKAYPGALAFNSLPLLGLSVVTAGIREGEGVTSIEARGGVYRRLFIRGGCLVGYISIGTPGREGILTFLIRRQIKVQSFLEKLAGEDFGWASLPTDLQKEFLNGGGALVNA